MDQIIADYISWDPNPETRQQVVELQQSLAASGPSEDQNKKLEALFGERVAFGTAGLRASMGYGYSKMNELVVLQTCQGLVKYLDQCFPDARERGVVFGYDHRQFGSISSKSLADISAAVFLAAGYKVYMLSNLVATPFVPFAIQHLKCVAGVMVTASHNPKIDNGYKLYWSNAAQIIPPHDSNISQHISENLKPWQSYSLDSVSSHSLYQDVTDEIVNSYYEILKTYSNRSTLSENSKSLLQIAYTPIHGIGQKWFEKAYDIYQFSKKFVSINEQKNPDPEFTTVAFPNPEENGAMDLLYKYGEENNCDLILANDPDADRLAAAERLKDSNGNPIGWCQFTGNQIGVLLGYWQIMNYKLKNQNSNKQPHVLASVVSSRMLKYVAEAEGVHYHDTLTGFKWLGNRATELREQGEHVIFMYEEALGYCVGESSCDKDGISAAMVFLEMASALAEGWTDTQGEKSGPSRTIIDLYSDLEKKYGKIAMNNWYVLSYNKNTTDKIFERLRTGLNGNYLNEINGVKVSEIVDVTTGYKSNPNSSTSLPLTPDSHMIMYTFENNVSVTLRTSGTEPKIKYYSEIRGNSDVSREELEKLLNNFIEKLIEEFLQPEINELVVKPKK